MITMEERAPITEQSRNATWQASVLPMAVSRANSRVTSFVNGA